MKHKFDSYYFYTNDGKIISYNANYYSYDYGINQRCYVLRFFNLNNMEYSHSFRIKLKSK